MVGAIEAKGRREMSNVLTEEDARWRWCPFARVTDAGDHVVNRDGTLGKLGKPEAGTYCVASDCMAWRWEINEVGRRSSGNRGYCGLAGAP
jgi:hypothetical protein